MIIVSTSAFMWDCSSTVCPYPTYMLTILPNVSATSSFTRPIQLKGEAADWNVPQNAASVQMARPLYLAMMKTHRWTVMISWNPPRTINPRLMMKRNGHTSYQLC